MSDSDTSSEPRSNVRIKFLVALIVFVVFVIVFEGHYSGVEALPYVIAFFAYFVWIASIRCEKCNLSLFRMGMREENRDLRIRKIIERGPRVIKEVGSFVAGRQCAECQLRRR